MSNSSPQPPSDSPSPSSSAPPDNAAESSPPTASQTPDAAASPPATEGSAKTPSGPAAGQGEASSAGRAKIQVGRTGPAPGGSQPASSEGKPAAPQGNELPGPTQASTDASERPEGRPRKDKKFGKERSKASQEPMVHRPTVPVPSRRQPLSPELEAEFHAALADLPLESLVDSNPKVGKPLEPDVRMQASVVRLHGDNVFFALSGRNEGVASVRQFANAPEPGATMEVVVKGYNSEDGLYEVTVPGASIDVSDWSDLDEGAIVEAMITGSNQGGLECQVSNIRGFIPASQVALYRIENFNDYVGQKLQCVVTEANPMRRNLVLSHRALLERQREESKKKLLEELEPGQTRDGVVRSIRDFGAFVDLGGVDGLVHISQLSWDRVQHPSEILQEGQKVRVKVERIDPDTGKISLSYRDLLEHPWTNIETRFPVGVVHKGTVTRLAKFGAFVKLAPGIEGLVHISEISHQPVRHLGAVLAEGQEVEVKIMSVDREAQRIGLSLKALSTPPELAEPDENEPPRQPAVAPRNEPLKGGTDRPSGGDRFGLKW